MAFHIQTARPVTQQIETLKKTPAGRKRLRPVAEILSGLRQHGPLHAPGLRTIQDGTSSSGHKLWLTIQAPAPEIAWGVVWWFDTADPELIRVITIRTLNIGDAPGESTSEPS